MVIVPCSVPITGRYQPYPRVVQPPSSQRKPPQRGREALIGRAADTDGECYDARALHVRFWQCIDGRTAA